VTIKNAEGTLSPGLNWWLIYPLGLSVAVPGWLLVASATRFFAISTWPRVTFLVVDIWLILFFVIVLRLGPSAPLAIPAVINLVSLLAQRRVEKPVLAFSGLVYAGMFVASLIVSF